MEDRLLSPSALTRFLKRCPEKGVELRALQIFRDGRLACRLAMPPYRCESKQQLYSLSKSFTSAAIGMLWDEKRLTLDDPVWGYFPDRLPESPQPYAKEIRVRDLLTMRSGHSACPFADMVNGYFGSGLDPIRAFFEHPLEHAPGTHFCYNTGASYLLSAIVTRITGLSALDYLTPRLFAPLGIRSPYWRCVEPGISAGGVELHVSCDDLAKFGLLIWNRGLWEGRRLLSEEYIALATGKQADNGDPATGSFWNAGYGFQFWQNARGGFRGDGAFGQVCFFRRDLGYLLVAMTESESMQDELTLMADLLEDGQTVVSDQTAEDARACVANHSSVPASEAGSFASYLGRWLVDGATLPLTAVTLAEADGGLTLTLSNGTHSAELALGLGEWRDSRCLLRGLAPDLFGSDPRQTDEQELMCACALRDGALELTFRYLNLPHTLRWTFAPGDGGLRTRLNFSQPSMIGGERLVLLRREETHQFA